jgi:two-component system sensor histidine kinase TtrS
MFLRRQAILFLFISLLSALSIPGGAATVPVRIGVLAWDDMEESEIRWSSLAQGLNQRLSQQLPGRVVELHHLDLEAMTQALQAGRLDFVVTNPGHYVTLEANSGVTRLATLVSGPLTDPGHIVGSAVVVLDSRSDLHRLADLNGKKLAAVSPDAFGGYQLAWAELKRIGLDPELDHPHPLFVGFPMTRVVDAVLSGTADAGVLRACLLEKLEQKGVLHPGQLRVLSPRSDVVACKVTSKLFPGWAFAAAGQAPPALSRDVLFALLSLPPDVAGQSWTVPADYHPVHELLKELKIGPYAFLRETGWDALLQRYWPLLAVLGLVLLLWGAYTFHVEHLVQRRTRELRQLLDEHRQLEGKIQAGQQQMDHLSRLSILGELSGTLAHELNQPLAAIGNYARSLIRRQDKGNLSTEALRQAAGEIASESERAAGILGSIRAFAKKRSQVREVHDVVALIREASSLMSGVLSRASVIVVSHELSEAKRQVIVDPLQIQQVLLNLFKNAWDAQQASGIDAPIEVAVAREEGRCVVTVRDHGSGLTPELEAHIFEAFFTTKPDGLGLGLSICKTIAEAHGGELQVQDAKPGLLFRFTLPLADALPAHEMENA